MMVGISNAHPGAKANSISASLPLNFFQSLALLPSQPRTGYECMTLGNPGSARGAASSADRAAYF